MGKFILVDKEYWKYQGLLWKTTRESWLKHFQGWKQVVEFLGISIFTTGFSILSLQIINGNISIKDVWIIVFSIFAGPIAYYLFMLLCKRIFASYQIFKDKDFESEKYNWKNFDFEFSTYDVFDISGWALRITNKKFYFDNAILRAEIKQIKINGKKTINPGGYSLQYIDRRSGEDEKRITACWHGILVPYTQTVDFVVTKLLQEQPLIYEFITYPDKDIVWPFNSGNDIQPIVIVEFEIQCNLTKGSEQWNLPNKKKKFAMTQDGNFSPYDKENEEQ